MRLEAESVCWPHRPWASPGTPATQDLYQSQDPESVNSDSVGAGASRTFLGDAAAWVSLGPGWERPAWGAQPSCASGQR